MSQSGHNQDYEASSNWGLHVLQWFLRACLLGKRFTKKRTLKEEKTIRDLSIGGQEVKVIWAAREVESEK